MLKFGLLFALIATSAVGVASFDEHHHHEEHHGHHHRGHSDCGFTCMTVQGDTNEQSCMEDTLPLSCHCESDVDDTYEIRISAVNGTGTCRCSDDQAIATARCCSLQDTHKFLSCYWIPNDNCHPDHITTTSQAKGSMCCLITGTSYDFHCTIPMDGYPVGDCSFDDDYVITSCECENPYKVPTYTLDNNACQCSSGTAKARCCRCLNHNHRG